MNVRRKTMANIKFNKIYAGFYEATTPAGHKIEIQDTDYGWVLSNTKSGAGRISSDPAPTLWEAKEDARTWDANMEASAAWAAKESERWGY
jgi:hypothetical protein